jgi:CRISPR-associated protein Cas1
MYENLAKLHSIRWRGRRYDPAEWDASDMPNRCLSAATAALHGLCEAAVLAAGYAPAIGFLHTGKPLSFVYDLADIWKFETVVPLAFQIAARSPAQPEGEVRRACRDIFRKARLLERLIPGIEEILAAGGLPIPEAPPETQPVAIPESEKLGDVGHRG